MTEETINLAEKLILFYNWENDKTVQRVHFGLKPNELKLAEAYLEKEKGKCCKRKEDIEEGHFWFQYITVDNVISEEEGSLTIVDDFFKRCFVSKQAILFSGMTVVAICQVDYATGNFYLNHYNTDSKFHSITSKLKKGLELINSSINLYDL